MKNISTLKINLTFFNPSDNEPICNSFDISTKVSRINEVAPSDKTIKNIMDFARSYKVLNCETTGYVELNIN